MPIVGVASYTSFEICTVTAHLGKNYALHIRASAGYESPFFNNIYYKSRSRSASCACKLLECYFFTGKFRTPRRGHPWSMMSLKGIFNNTVGICLIISTNIVDTKLSSQTKNGKQAAQRKADDLTLTSRALLLPLLRQLFNDAVACCHSTASVTGEWTNEWVCSNGGMILAGEKGDTWTEARPSATLSTTNSVHVLPPSYVENEGFKSRVDDQLWQIYMILLSSSTQFRDSSSK